MKSVVICEGNTDLVLIQYFLEKVYQWEYIEEKNYKNYEAGFINKIKDTKGLKWFSHGSEDFLCIIASGGVSKIPKMLGKILDLNNLGAIKSFDKVVVISDRDEITTESEFIAELKTTFSEFNINFESEIGNDIWNKVVYTNSISDECKVEFLPLIIPFEETGAIEQFLLNALLEESERNDPLKINKQVIEQCIQFIENINCHGKYLTHRREKTKAKFDTVFVVLIPAEAFNQRRSLLREIEWEKYENIQNGFKKLGELLEK